MNKFGIPKNQSVLPYSSSLQPINQLLKGKYANKPLPLKRSSWWSPLWTGLVADSESKHRKAMGSAIWLYLYLLMYMKRSSGLVFRRQSVMSRETGFSLRTIQKHLLRLKQNDYISTEKQGNTLRIYIVNWKTFWDKKRTDHNPPIKPPKE